MQASNRWAEAHLEDDEASVLDQMLAETGRVTGIDTGQAELVRLHRWRFANPGRQTGEPAFVDASMQLAAIGDWCIHGRVEAAFQSGRQGAIQVQSQL